jgi:dipeptidyl aminopeptidase/acylaminoacyl peptidase
MLGTASDAGTPGAKDTVLTVTNRVAAVVAFFPPTDLRGLTVTRDKDGNLVGEYKAFPALEFDPAKAPACSPLDHVSSDDPPTLLIHGDKDKLVPLEHSTRIQEAFQKHKVTSELMVIKGAAHGFTGEALTRAVNASVAWFEKHLCPKPEPGAAK